LASDKGFLRNNLRGGLLESFMLNERNVDLLGLDQIRIFEVGTVFKTDRENTALGIGVKNTRGYYGGKTEQEGLKDIVVSLSTHLGAKLPSGEYKDGIFEINFDELIKKLPQPDKYESFEKSAKKVIYQPISPYPFVLRDIAVWVPKGTTSDTVLTIIKQKAGELLVTEKLFDEYQKNDKASYAFHLIFQSYEKTLTDEEINQIMEKITVFLNKKTGWEVR